MATTLTDKLSRLVKTLSGQARITESNVADMLREVRMALLEADVNFKVARDFIERVKAKSIGAEVIQSVQPGQQIVKIIADELTELLGSQNAGLNFGGVSGQTNQASTNNTYLDRASQGVKAAWTKIVSPNMVNEVRWQYAYDNRIQRPNSTLAQVTINDFGTLGGNSSGTFIQSAMPSNRLTAMPLPLPVMPRSISASSTAACAAMPHAISHADTPTRPGPAGCPVIMARPDSACTSRS